MKRIPKNKWINALLANYRQGKGYLKQRHIGEEEYRFSALGVLEDVYIEHIDYCRPENIGTWYQHEDEDGIIYWTRGDKDDHKLSSDTARWAQIPCDPKVDIKIGGETISSPMSILNDKYNLPFTDFAEIIKEQL